MDKRQARDFEDFVAVSGNALMATAVLLTADRHHAEDVYQRTLERLAARWSRVDNPRAFCRRVLHNLVIDDARARAARPGERELLGTDGGSDPRATDAHAGVELRPALLAALDTLTSHQRAVVVLRYFEDRSEADVADLLGVSVGTVKSSASRAVARLRATHEVLALQPERAVINRERETT